ncbi:P-loop containing nucleoside triphosphate hydrolase protein [Atractiella rhizophila]|nr:P-loop containing nucleoside triphosphate hydrolase protein [Atractiella rhizophila]
MSDKSDEDYVPYVPLKERRAAQLAALSQSKSVRPAKRKIVEDEEEKRRHEARKAEVTLLQTSQKVREVRLKEDELKSEFQKKAEEEAKILEAQKASQRKLASDMELAKGITYTEPIKLSWVPPRWIRERSEAENQRIRDKHHIDADGNNIPPPIPRFEDMRLPTPIFSYLKQKNIKAPTPIQLQGLPVAMSGRDLIGIAFTGSGKTLSFAIPLVLQAVEEEMKLPFLGGEGPVGMIICPSRELARQTHETFVQMAREMENGGFPSIGVLLCIGGISMSEQRHVLSRGFHIVVATPGRLQDMLEKKKFTLNNCRYLCLDEADRMIDMGFEEDVRNIMSYFSHQRQTLLFSATMPSKIRDFAQHSLIQPVVVNVGRAGAANLDVIQEVEYVKQEAKMVYLLECLQKTAPPVIVFSDNKNEVDDIQEYLLLKGVEAVAIHGGKTQEERDYAIRAFKTGKKDVMVASGVASKGLDFAEIQHVINFGMPKEIEDYVHQIGRTGRSGKTGIATTFINMNTAEETLLDLKYLLREAKQKIPPFLMSLEDPNEGIAASSGIRPGGCAICGGLGHGVGNCPKLEENQRRTVAAHRGMRDEGGY